MAGLANLLPLKALCALFKERQKKEFREEASVTK